MSHGPAHRVGGVTAWLAVAPHLAIPGWQVAAGAVIAGATAHGRLSPDVDNTRTWRRVDPYVPDEALGGNGPLAHRGVAHWWGLPALALGWVALGHDPGVLAWEVAAVAVAWASHVALDAVFGQQPPGVPLAPWGWHVGLRLDSGGVVERWLALPVLTLACGWLSWRSLGGPSLPEVARAAGWTP